MTSFPPLCARHKHLVTVQISQHVYVYGCSDLSHWYHPTARTVAPFVVIVPEMLRINPPGHRNYLPLH